MKNSVASNWIFLTEDNLRLKFQNSEGIKIILLDDRGILDTGLGNNTIKIFTAGWGGGHEEDKSCEHTTHCVGIMCDPALSSPEDALTRVPPCTQVLFPLESWVEGRRASSLSGRRRIPCRFFSIEATRNVQDLFYFRSPPLLSFCFLPWQFFFLSTLRLFGFIVYLERSSHAAAANFKGSFLPARVLFLRADQIFPGKPQANWPYQMARICTNKISNASNTLYIHSTLNVSSIF